MHQQQAVSASHGMDSTRAQGAQSPARESTLVPFSSRPVPVKDPVASYPQSGTTSDVRKWAHSNHEQLDRMAKEATLKADASGLREDHRAASKLHDYARFAHLYVSPMDGPASKQASDPHARTAAEHQVAVIRHLNLAVAKEPSSMERGA